MRGRHGHGAATASPQKGGWVSQGPASPRLRCCDRKPFYSFPAALRFLLFFFFFARFFFSLFSSPSLFCSLAASSPVRHCLRGSCNTPDLDTGVGFLRILKGPPPLRVWSTYLLTNGRQDGDFFPLHVNTTLRLISPQPPRLTCNTKKTRHNKLSVHSKKINKNRERGKNNHNNLSAAAARPGRAAGPIQRTST